MPDEKHEPLHIVVMTGGTGRTGEHVLAAALAQFDNPDVRITVERNVRSKSVAEKIIQRAKEDHAVIFHTIVSPEIRRLISQQTDALTIPTIDLLGPVITVLDDHLDGAPRNQPGLSYAFNKEQFDRIDAVDFTLAHDDGIRVKDLANADVVLTGVSRVSKSVTCFFLAYRGIRAANVPLQLGIDPPSELLNIDPDNVIVLTMNVQRLSSIRETRNVRWKGAMRDYTDLGRIGQELQFANKLASEHGWRCIDVSYKAVEEVASDIASLIRFKQRVAG